MNDQTSVVKRVAGELKKDRFSIGKTKFRIIKLLPMEAYEVMECIRVGLGPSLASLEVSESGKISLADFLSLVMSLPRETLREVRDALFAEVRFQNQAAKTPLPVGGNEDMAFDGLGFLAVYEVLARAVMVNFGESLAEKLRPLEAATSPDISPSA